jgi:hypothetical protein
VSSQTSSFDPLFSGQPESSSHRSRLRTDAVALLHIARHLKTTSTSSVGRIGFGATHSASGESMKGGHSHKGCFHVLAPHANATNSRFNSAPAVFDWLAEVSPIPAICGGSMGKPAEKNSEDSSTDKPTDSTAGPEIDVRISSVPCPDLHRRLNQIYKMALARYHEMRANKGGNGNG